MKAQPEGVRNTPGNDDPVDRIPRSYPMQADHQACQQDDRSGDAQQHELLHQVPAIREPHQGGLREWESGAGVFRVVAVFVFPAHLRVPVLFWLNAVLLVVIPKMIHHAVGSAGT